MEQGPLTAVRSPILEKPKIKKILELLKETVKDAEEAQELQAAKDPLVRAAIVIVEEFLKDTGRICYGGQAINAHLPTELKIYDSETTIPDYDVYTPNPEKDRRDIMNRLRAAGFPEVGHRESLHQGTYKISVAFNDILDLTIMDKQIYTILEERSKTISGIKYADIDFLEMNMYKELSQPEGEIDRWEKVWPRLILLDSVGKREKQKMCKLATAEAASVPQKELLLNYILENKRVLIGGNLETIYQSNKGEKTKIQWLMNGPLMFYSPNIEQDIIAIRESIGNSLKITQWEATGEIIPKMVTVEIVGASSNSHRSVPIALIVEEWACHSYNEIGNGIRIASLPTLARLWLAFEFIKSPAIPKQFLAGKSIHCIANAFVRLAMNQWLSGRRSSWPLFSITCSGHQETKKSLVRAKKLRGKLARVEEAAAQK